jgi:hypothetical protein
LGVGGTQAWTRDAGIAEIGTAARIDSATWTLGHPPEYDRGVAQRADVACGSLADSRMPTHNQPAGVDSWLLATGEISAIALNRFIP